MEVCRYGILHMSLAVFCGSLLGCDPPPPTDIPEIIRPVRSEEVFLTGSDQVRTFSGTAKAGLEAKLSFKISGTVQRLLVRVGDKVQQGQVLDRTLLSPRSFSGPL